tara:strand:+ start:8891 stop:9820 length:930 start_codon:yes stop_codon:yes gene_type:complete
MSDLVVILGPTATGKTKLAIEIALAINGEIVNVDSRQVYRFMDIGTAKPTKDECASTPHHLIDILNPDEMYSVGSFIADAVHTINQIRERGSVPILAGGTGQYIWSLLEGWNVPIVPPSDSFRAEKEAQVATYGYQFLYDELQDLDPERAFQIDPRNVRRVIRALEIIHIGGIKPSDVPSRRNENYAPLIIGLTMNRSDLYAKIDDRVEQMMDMGLLEEVNSLKEMGYCLGEGALDSPGYRELGDYLTDSLSLVQAVEKTKYQTHKLARRQYTWFKKDDPRIHWLDSSTPEVLGKAKRLLSQTYPQASL